MRLMKRAPSSIGIGSLRLAAGILVAALGLGCWAGGTAAEHRYVLATATAGGTFYPVGVALATVVRVRLQATQGIDLTAIASSGSGENVHLLRENEAQFALVSALIGYQARRGEGQFAHDGPQRHLRAVTALWQEPEHYLVRAAYAHTGTIEDMQGLRGRRVSLGLENSATLALSRTLLKQLGFDVERDFELVYLGYDAGAEALQQGQIEAMSAQGGVPVTAVNRALAGLGDRLVVLEFTDEQLDIVNHGLDLWSRYVIAPGTYPSQDRPIRTVAAPSLLAVRATLDEDAVYWITRTIYENLPFLHAIHPALREVGLDNALRGLPLPLHPGALRYYREAGLAVPARLSGE